MARIRSLIIRAEVDTALKAHNCQRVSSHRIVRGEKRLKVRSGRSWKHYCLSCARAIVERDVAKLSTLLDSFHDKNE